MIFDVYTKDAGVRSGGEGSLREATRMACIAYGLARLGHDVHLVKPNRVLVNSEDVLPGSTRWHVFKHLEGPPRPGAISVEAAESKHHCDVAIKCSVGIKDDAAYLTRCKVLVAHECSDAVANDPRVVHVPFLLHEMVIRDFVTMGLMGAYLDDDLDKITDLLSYDDRGLIGYMGAGWGHRREMVNGAPDWATISFHDGAHAIGGFEHMQWMSGFWSGLVLRGDTPKVNLTPLLAMIGIPIVGHFAERNTPALTEDSMIFFDGDWQRLYDKLHGSQYLKRICRNATTAYLAGWSPTGQARLICNALEGTT